MGLVLIFIGAGLIGTGISYNNAVLGILGAMLIYVGTVIDERRNK